MSPPLIRISFLIACLALVGFTTPIPSRETLAYRPRVVVSPHDLINAVNALRTSYGLAPYSISPILMSTAQAQADFMASTGDVTHSGPGGIGLTDRLLAAGYPLGGELSAGGFRAENITSGNEERTAESVVEGWGGDALHLNTMISSNLSEIGAGVAIADGRVYFVIDCAQPATDALSQETSSIPEGGSTAPTGEVAVHTAIPSTPNPDGDVIHEVKTGESLWQLASAYDVKIDDIRRLNDLFDDTIYPGSKLLIKQGVVQPTALLTMEPGITNTIAPIPQAASSSTAITFTSTEIASWSPEASMPGDSSSILLITFGILILALLGGGVFTWLGNRKKTQG